MLLLVGVAWVLQNRGVGIPGGNFVPLGGTNVPPALTAPPGASSELPPGVSLGLQTPKLRIDRASVDTTSPDEEYITLENIDLEGKIKILLSGLILKNKNNHSAAIGKDENGANITLGQGERAVIITGVSPRGINFKLNKCSGYFNQNYSFIPSVPSFCPQIANLPQARNLKARCIDYLETLPTCQRVDPGLESGDFECSEFIAKHASYAGCALDHKNDEDFDKKEWRIYLGKSEEFWGNRHDDIKLFDQSGNLIAELAY